MTQSDERKQPEETPEEYSAAPGAVARLVGDETVVVDLDREQYFSLNPTGSIVWSFMSNGATQAAAADELVHRYDVSRDEAANDVAELVAQLVERGLLLPAD